MSTRFATVPVLLLALVAHLVAASEPARPLVHEDATSERIASDRRPEEVVIMTREQVGRWTYGIICASLLLVLLAVTAWVVALRRKIAVRRRAEGALRESETRFRAIFERSPMGIAVADPRSGRFLQVNPSYCLIVGRTAEELAGGNLADVTHPEDLGANLAQLTELTAGRIDHFAMRKRYLRPDGAIVWVDLTVIALVEPDHTVTRAFALVEDITERRRIEQEIVDHREHLEELVAERTRGLHHEQRLIEQYFNVTRSLTVTLDLDGVVTRLNPYGCELLGWSAEEIVGRNWYRTCVPADGADQVFAYFCRLVRHGQPEDRAAFERDSYQNEVVTRSGERRFLVFRNSFLRDEQGTVIGTLSSAIDVTGTRLAALELQRAKDAAEAANRAKSDFLASMSHEIRTPLNAVLGYAQLLARDATLAAPHRRAVEIINRSGEHLLALISDILEMSRIEAGRSTRDDEDFDLHALLDNLKSLFFLRARDKGLDFAITLQPGLPRYIRADQRKLRQILFNLLANALKFTHRGVIEVGARTAEGRLSLTVSDTGPGIAAEELAQLFQPFVQAQAGRRRGEGSGLGLALSRGFASVLGGELTAQSELGHGSSFTVAVPFAIASAAQRLPASRRQVIGLAPGIPPPRILIAEDHAESRDLLHDLLSGIGCEVLTVADGAAAVAAARDWRPGLVWMDIDMPVMDGLAAAQAIRAGSAAPPVIVAVTAAAFEPDRTRILAGGCDEVVHKPYREEDLFAVMERLLATRFVWRELTPPSLTREHGDAELRAGLAALPAADLARLREAIVTGDLLAVTTLAQGWSDRRMADGISELSEAFSIARLQALVASGDPR